MTKSKVLSLFSSFGTHPTTTDSTIIFPYDKKSKTFNHILYYSELTDGRATISEVTDFLYQAELIIKQRKGSVRAFASLIVSLVLIAFLGLALYSGDFFNLEHDLVYIAIGGYSCFVLLNAGILQAYKRYRRKNIRMYVQDLAARYSDVFEDRGLKWNLPSSFPSWIELHKKYKQQEGYNKSSFVIPVNNYSRQGGVMYGQNFEDGLSYQGAYV